MREASASEVQARQVPAPRPTGDGLIDERDAREGSGSSPVTSITGSGDRSVGRTAPTVALVHDYLTQRGGAERVVLSMLRAFPEAPLHTSLYEPQATYGGFAGADVRTLPMDRIRGLRSRHRLALPLLAPSFGRLRVDADVAVCSSSGWAHGARTSGRKVVYCHSPAKWLHQPERYEVSRGVSKVAIRFLRPSLLSWDRRAAASADRYLVNSSAVQGWVRDAYGIESEVLAPPGGVDPAGPTEEVEGVDPGFLLCVSRLMRYKNVGAVIDGIAALPDERLVVVGNGPEAAALAARRPPGVTLLSGLSDAQLRWLYRSCSGLVAAAQEDFGLTPLEAGSFGKPVVALRWGGFLDTVVEGETGVFMDVASPAAVAQAVRDLRGGSWDATRIEAHAASYSEGRFIERLRAVVAEEAGAA